jgi:hypothetical protein
LPQIAEDLEKGAIELTHPTLAKLRELYEMPWFDYLEVLLCDPLAASAHSRWLASQVPSAGLTVWPGVGHLHTTVERWTKVLASLA